MATRPMKTITGLPGLEGNTYTFVQIDNQLATAGKAADAKAVGDALAEINETLPTKADKDGSYESMTVGNAEQLVSTVGIEDSVPYLLRTTGGSADIGDRVKLSKITGGTVAWNQLFQTNYQGGPLSDDLQYTVDEGRTTFTFNGTTTAVRYMALTWLPSCITGHVYLLNRGTNTNGISLYNDNNGVKADDTHPITIGKSTANIYFYLRFDSGLTFNNAVVKSQIFDLTQMFGSTIANYIYTLETSTAGAGVAQLKAWGFFTKPYYAYDAGSLLSVETSAHREVGFNQWDEEWEVGGISTTTGEKETDSGIIRSKNYIPVIPGQTYYVKAGTAGQTTWQLYLFFYDADMNYLGSYIYIRNYTRTMPDNCRYVMFKTTSAYGGTYKNDICINLHWDGERDGEYEPYEEHTYPLDSDLVLRGIAKLDANNNLYYKGDEYTPDGNVSRKWYLLENLKSLTWYSNGGTNPGQFCAALPQPSVVGGDAILSNGIYTVSQVGAYNGTNMHCSVRGNLIWIVDSGYASTGTEAFANSLQNVQLLYELATPTTESADPYQETQICNDFGIEEFVDTRTVPIPVGYTALYQPNLRAKLEMAPDSPDGSGDFIVRQTNGTNEYVAISSNETISGLTTRCPACPTGTDGTFTLKATVSNGSITYSWESDT